MTGDESPSPRPERRGSPTRGFLFADLRGYTAFVERHGAHRAAAMLDRYRRLVRAAVAGFDGAEIRTEGDSFYVVFDGASAAIQCGLAIVAAASEAGETDPATAIKVGVGIHAGETVETAEGYVGSAVNTAARICARAGPNQVLVSGTVRALTAGVVDAAFVPVGRRRLKGLHDPIDLYRVAAGPDAFETRATIALIRGRRVGLAALGTLILAVLFVAAIARPSFGPASAELGEGSESSEPATLAPLVAASMTSAVETAPETEAFPTAAEARLLERLDEAVARHCRRADPGEVPVFTDDPTEIPLPYDAGLECRLGAAAEPDVVWYWSAVPGQRIELVSAIFFQAAGRRSLPPGDCATDDVAYGRWDFADTHGSLLCFGSRDATLMWTYDDENLLATAVRSDGDIRTLYSWWRDHARLLGT